MDRIDQIASDFANFIEGSRHPGSVKRAILLHLNKPWVKGFSIVAISPIRQGTENYLADYLFHAGKRDWFFPSEQWWLSHANRSHEPAGNGCDVDLHVAFLTREGANAEFEYANVLKDGTVNILDEDDFLMECTFWARNVEP